ncbi:hypothetical protein HO133_003936 [Letharia lupina]|uniref:SET domain-containing protein n=1 Tax=Letharia lupina TaxID=560253 RepID=A0A8H6F9D9_9LECA|nr:uncharacterized protein HO133_003936 [Letharia lupina]KAF6219469.1 hypothetical protein HO133_003936 [Letharia lupina]
MKSPPRSGSSGSSTASKKAASHPTDSGVKKQSARTETSGGVCKATKGEIPRGDKKWQTFFGSTREISADDETVRAQLFDVLKEKDSKKEADKSSSRDVGRCSKYNVNRLMAQIYQDLYTVAAAQASKAASGETQTDRLSLGELGGIDLALRKVSDGVGTAIKAVLAYQRNPASPESSRIWQHGDNTVRSSSFDGPVCERCSKLASRHDWTLLGILAHSVTFQDAITLLDAEAWNAISTSIAENAVSLTVFAQGHSLEWWTELIRLNGLSPPFLPQDFERHLPSEPRDEVHPHKWVVTDNLSDVHPPHFEGEPQINIHTNIYRAASFANSPRPPSWPADRPYPSDPTRVRDPSPHPCPTSGPHAPCACLFHARTWHPLTELRAYGPKGVGVRALERIPTGAILGEYVGEVHPAAYAVDPTYVLDFSEPGRRTDEVVATINAGRFGNWTRFVNHSCEASTRFASVTLGGRHRTVVQAVRDIEVFEELTVDYGVGYWRNRGRGDGAGSGDLGVYDDQAKGKGG